MKKNIINSILIVSVFTLFLISCGKADVATSNNLIGNWQSTQVDSLYHFIVPEAPDTFISCDYPTNRLEIHEDGSFKMMDRADTILGDWNQSATDTLMLTVKDKQGNVCYKRSAKIKNVDQHELILINSGGIFSGALYCGDTTGTTTLDTRYEAKVYYVRKSQN